MNVAYKIGQYLALEKAGLYGPEQYDSDPKDLNPTPRSSYPSPADKNWYPAVSDNPKNDETGENGVPYDLVDQAQREGRVDRIWDLTSGYNKSNIGDNQTDLMPSTPNATSDQFY